MKLTFTLCCKPSYQPKLQKGNAENVEVNVRNNYDVSGGSTLSLSRIHLKQAIVLMSLLMCSSQVQRKMSQLSCPNLLFCFFCQQVHNSNSFSLRYITVNIIIYAWPIDVYSALYHPGSSSCFMLFMPFHISAWKISGGGGGGGLTTYDLKPLSFVNVLQQVKHRWISIHRI